jgi:hypothetical protein
VIKEHKFNAFKQSPGPGLMPDISRMSRKEQLTSSIRILPSIEGKILIEEVNRHARGKYSAKYVTLTRPTPTYIEMDS